MERKDETKLLASLTEALVDNPRVSTDAYDALSARIGTACARLAALETAEVAA